MRWMLHSAIWRIPSHDRVLYLTFDDGPTKRCAEILDLLDAYDAKATFFCVGENVKKNPELFEELLMRGHAVGQHTFSHLNGWKVSLSVYLKDIEQAQEWIPSKLFRPPYGKMTSQQYRNLKSKFKIVMWTHLSYDFDLEFNEIKFFKRFYTKFKSGDIVVLHDNLKCFDKSKSMLEVFLRWAKENNIQCRAIKEEDVKL